MTVSARRATLDRMRGGLFVVAVLFAACDPADAVAPGPTYELAVYGRGSTLDCGLADAVRDGDRLILDATDLEAPTLGDRTCSPFVEGWDGALEPALVTTCPGAEDTVSIALWPSTRGGTLVQGTGSCSVGFDVVLH